jgi:hypothetical protein
MSKNICRKTEKFNFIDRNDIYKEVCKIIILIIYTTDIIKK